MKRLAIVLVWLMASGVSVAQTLPPTQGVGEWWWNGSAWVPTSAANPLPVAGTFSAGSASVAYAASTTGTVTTSATIVAAPGVKSTNICNTTVAGGGTLWLELSGGTAVISQGIPIAAGNNCGFFGPLTNANGNIIKAVSDLGTISFTITLGN